MSEIATNITADQKERRVFTKPIGNYTYTVENNGFGEYRIIRRVKTQDKPAEYWRKLHDKNENGTI